LCLISVSSVPGCNCRKFTSSMKALIRKIPRPDPRRIFSGANGSGILSGSSPGPWSATRIIKESAVVSNDAVTCFDESYEFPCRTAFTAASRTAIAICGIVSSSNPARCAHCSATCSILLTLSRDESRVKLTRLVVESAKAILKLPMCQLSTADNRDDGSLLVDFANVKDYSYFPLQPLSLPQFRRLIGSYTDQRQRGLTCGYEDYFECARSRPCFHRFFCLPQP